MHLDREGQRIWLRGVLEKTGLTPTALARVAKLSQSTITRFLASENAPMLGLRSIQKIVAATELAPPGINGKGGEGGDEFREGEASRFIDDTQAGSERVRAAVAAIIGDRQAADPWVMRSDALKFAGYLPGDILIVDISRMPVSGEVACAQVYQWEQGKAGTIFRLYEPPYLLAASDAPEMRRPLLVDNNHVVLKGVVTESLRLRG
jgi:transcriptional regulator with XRE-family HTH domain